MIGLYLRLVELFTLEAGTAGHLGPMGFEDIRKRKDIECDVLVPIDALELNSMPSTL